jgi:hypothetical protein
VSLLQKFFIAKKVPKGKPIKQERSKEIPLTFKDSNNISNKSSSKVITNSNDFANASNKIFMFMLICHVLNCNIMLNLRKLQFLHFIAG